jgi:hypothetical protein
MAQFPPPSCRCGLLAASRHLLFFGIRATPDAQTPTPDPGVVRSHGQIGRQPLHACILYSTGWTRSKEDQRRGGYQLFGPPPHQATLPPSARLPRTPSGCPRQRPRACPSSLLSAKTAAALESELYASLTSWRPTPALPLASAGLL